MNKPTTEYVLPRWLRGWEQFWFTPADPSLLALIRIATGLIVVYTFAVYSFSLQDFMGENAWHDMILRDQIRHGRPVNTGAFQWNVGRPLPAPKNDFEAKYLEDYVRNHDREPPPPYPADEKEAAELEKFIEDFKIDLRINGLKPPQDEFQRRYAAAYTARWKAPPPAYPKDLEEEAAITAYMEEFQQDPRILYDRGMPVFSIYFHVLDPMWMLVIHWGFVAASVMFLIGCCTRITTALTWFGLLCYIHRNPTTLFGVDTMMLIMLLYLMVSPCGAVCSIDALLRRWWVGAKPGVVERWYRLFGKTPPATIPPAAPAEVVPTVSANIAIRLMQIHICIIYLVAGLTKLQGQAWWNGNALWLTLGNYEFAPMQFEIYLKLLRFFGRHLWVFEIAMTAGGLFTLAFEIAYAFLIWRPRLRWILLGCAILLHGLIGLFMGLKTFSLMMLVMNMAFLTKEEVHWFLNWFTPLTPTAPPAWSATPATPTAPAAPQPVAAGVTGATGITRK